MLTLFKNANFTKLFLGRLTTNIGDSLYAVAAMWLVYELGGSAFFTGVAGFLTLLPQALQFLAGPFVDRWTLRKTLVTTQILQAVLILVIPIASFTGWLSVTLVLVIMPIVSFIEQFAYPAQTAALPRILEKNLLVKGNSAFTFAYQGIDVAFNALAGIMVAFFGAVTIYIIDSVTFAMAALLFFSIKMPENEKEKPAEEKRSVGNAVRRYKKELAEGFRFVIGSIIAKFFIASVVANFAIGATMAIMPAYADLRGGAEIYGFYLTSMSVGVLLGALLASLLEKFALGKLSVIAFTIGATCWIASVFVPSALISIALFGLAWLPIGATNVIFAAVLQRIVPERLLARTTSVIVSIGTSAMPLGSLIGGTFGSIYGSQAVFAATGLGILFIAVVWLIIPALRQLPAANSLEPETVGLAEETSA